MMTSFLSVLREIFKTKAFSYKLWHSSMYLLIVSAETLPCIAAKQESANKCFELRNVGNFILSFRAVVP